MHISPSLRMVLIIKTHLVIHAQMFWVKGLAKGQLLRMSGKDTITYFPLILRDSFGFTTDFIFNSSGSTFGHILDHKCATKVLANNKSCEVSQRNNGPRFCL